MSNSAQQQNTTISILNARRAFSQTSWNPDGRNLRASFWRMYHNKQKGGWIQYGSERLNLLPDQLMIIAPCTDFTVSQTGPVDHFFLHFHAYPFFDLIQDLVVVSPLQPQQHTAIERIVQGTSAAATQAAALSLVGQALAELDDTHLQPLHNDPRLWTVMHHCQANLSQPLTNGDLAELCNIHVDTFSRLFKKHVGMSPQAYVRRQRALKAAALLNEGLLSMKQIAQTCGCCDRHHLTRIFSQEMGISPRRFQKGGSC